MAQCLRLELAKVPLLVNMYCRWITDLINKPLKVSQSRHKIYELELYSSNYIITVSTTT